MQDIYTVGQVAERLGRSPSTIRRWISQGKLAAKKVGRDYLVAGDSLAEAEERGPHAVDRKALAREFITFMQFLNLPYDCMHED